MTQNIDCDANCGAAGAVLHAPAHYDFLVWLFLLGRERAFREKILALARVQAGETVLDVGCGTGTLAIAAKHKVGPSGTVHAIDASPAMLAKAGKKAGRAGTDVHFRHASAHALPFPDAQFDLALLTLVLHHLPRKARQQCAFEIRRVLKPAGRALVVDFELSAGQRKGILAHFHRHGHVKRHDVVDLLRAAELQCIESGAMGIRDLQFVLARRHAVHAGVEAATEG